MNQAFVSLIANGCLLAAHFTSIGAAYGRPLSTSSCGDSEESRPNVILIVADDMGFGDVGWHGNPVIRTPNLDALRRQGCEITRFYVSPVCAPTRASLMTGRYNYRTRVVDTYQGRAMMDPAEVTLAEMLRSAGYACGIFGKWHLGDNYPLRPMDQGFAESLVHRGGGIGQPSDLIDGTSYFNPGLLRNGQPVKTRGYCTDIFTDAALTFIKEHREEPFFVYLPYNAPHEPLEVPNRWLAYYKNRDLRTVATIDAPAGPERERQIESIARVYAMISEIDDNVGALLNKLDDWQLANNTIVIFTTDNGPQQERFNGALRGLKGSVYEGGIRAPCVVRWPGVLAANREIETPAAHIDLLPTLLEACRVAPPAGVKLDGRSILPLLKREARTLPERPFFVQWHRGNVPQEGRACAVVTTRWKLVQAQGVPEDPTPFTPRWQLFNLAADASEQYDVAAENSQIVDDLRRQYDAWFRDVSGTRGFDPPRIVLGAAQANPVELTRQDWRVEPAAATQTNAMGHWEIEVASASTFRIKVIAMPQTPRGVVHLKVGGIELSQKMQAESDVVPLVECRLPAGPAQVEAWIEVETKEVKGPRRIGPRFVEFSKTQ